MKKGMNRRDFLKWAGAGTAVATVPMLSSGCASSKAVRVEASPARGAHQTYFDRFGVDAGLLRRTITKGLSRGGDFCDVFLQHRINHWLGLEDGEVNRAYSVVDLGAGIRVLKGDATGFAYSEDLSEKALLAASETAAAVADAGPKAQVQPLAAVEVESRYALDTPWSELGVDNKLPVLKKTDKLVRGRDARIIKVTVYMNDESSHILVANSEGLLVEDDQPMTMLYASCVATHNGKVETGYQILSARDGLRFFSEKNIARMAREAADHTTMLFDAVPPPIGELPVVLAPGISGILLHEAIGHGMEADFNRKGISIYAGRIGKPIAPKSVTIVDDGTNERLRGSINIDDEGVAGQRTVLVDNGILRSYLHDRISAKHYKLASTGSGRRQSFRFPPVPRMRNTYMLNGPDKPEDIVASVKKGLYAEQFSNGQVMIGGGDFTFYLKHGRMIENGKLTAVVKDANLIGSGPKVLENMQMVGDDMAMSSGGGTCGKDGQGVPVDFGLPTVKAGAISIGGRKS